MNAPLKSDQEFEQWERGLVSDPADLRATASAAMVNRTHRIVRERARTMQEQKRKVSSLWIPLAVSGCLLAVFLFNLWTAFQEYEAAPGGIPDFSQTLALLMWSVPLSAMLLAVVWLRRSNSKTDNERA